MAGRVKADRQKIGTKDILLKARMLSEGVRVEVKKAPPGWNLPGLSGDPSEKAHRPIQVDASNGDDIIAAIKRQEEFLFQESLLGNVIILDVSEIPAPIISSERSSLTLTLEGRRAEISECGQLLGKGAFYSPSAGHPWSHRRLRNGLSIDHVLFGSSPGIVNVLFNLSCYNHNSNQACRYCGLFGNSASEKIVELPLSALRGYAGLQAEAVKIMTDFGWRGYSKASTSVSPRASFPSRCSSCPLPMRLLPRLPPGALRGSSTSRNESRRPTFATASM